MKVLAFSDTHLGAQRYNLVWFKDALKHAFISALEIAADNNVDLVIFTGDLFDTPFVEPSDILFALQAFKKFNFNIIAITGNHDIRSDKPYETSPVALLEESYPKMKVLTNTNPCYHYNDVNFIGIPYITPIQFIEYRKHTSMLERYYKYIDTKYVNIALLHQDLSILDYAKHMWHTALNLSDIEPFDFSIIGHYHNKVEHKKFLYPGSTYPLSFKQSHVAKGVYLLNIDNNSISYEFIPIKPLKSLKEIHVTYPFDETYVFQESNADVVKLVVTVEEKVLQEAISFVRNNIRPVLSKQLDKFIVDFDIQESYTKVNVEYNTTFDIESFSQLANIADYDNLKHFDVKTVKKLLHEVENFVSPYKSMDKRISQAINILQRVVG